MLCVGHDFPQVSLPSTHLKDGAISSDVFSSAENQQGSWRIFFFFPKAFTPICHSEVKYFMSKTGQFNAEVYGVSVDSDIVQSLWLEQEFKERPGQVTLLSDIAHDLSSSLGVLQKESGISNRVTYIVDPEGKIRFVMMTDLVVGPNLDEVLRVLEASQEGGFVHWSPE